MLLIFVLLHVIEIIFLQIFVNFLCTIDSSIVNLLPLCFYILGQISTIILCKSSNLAIFRKIERIYCAMCADLHVLRATHITNVNN